MGYRAFNQLRKHGHFSGSSRSSASRLSIQRVAIATPRHGP